MYLNVADRTSNGLDSHKNHNTMYYTRDDDFVQLNVKTCNMKGQVRI